MEILIGTSRNNLQEDLAELQDNGVHDFFSEHIALLEEKIAVVPEYSCESRILRGQIEELYELNTIFEGEFQRPFTRESNEEINQRFQSILMLIELGIDLRETREEIEGLIDDELDRLEDRIFGRRTSRDIVENSINIQGRVFDGYFESNYLESFYNYFTIEYINILGRENSIIDEGYLQVSLEDLVSIFNRVRDRLSEEEVQELYDYVFDIDLEDEIVTIAFSSIVDDSNEISEGGSAVPTRSIEETEVIPDPLDLDEQEGVDDSIVYTYSPEQLLHEYTIGNISRESAMEILEGENGFQADQLGGYTLGEAIEDYGLGESLLADIDIIFRRELSEEEVQNLCLAIRYFLYIESSGGYNVSNYEGVSTAKGYFQYLTGNGRFMREVLVDGVWERRNEWNATYEQTPTQRRVWGTNSYETALGHIPINIIQEREVFQNEIQNIGNPELQDPRNLSADEQIILFLSDLIQRPGAGRYIDAMLAGDIDAVEELYILHHTNPDRDTELRMLLAVREIYGREIEVFSQTPNGIEGIILPGVNITDFFEGIIREVNPNTSFITSEISSGLMSLGNIAFPAGGRIEIRRSLQDGVAYTLTLNDREYIQINADKTFVYLR